MSKEAERKETELILLADAAKVYAILDQRSLLIKIGRSRNVDKRLLELQRPNPHKLTVLFTIHCSTHEQTYTLESELHTIFAAYRMRGEWFNMPFAELRTCIDGLTQARGLTITWRGDWRLIRDVKPDYNAP